MWLGVLIVTSKYSLENWEHRESLDNQEIQITEVQIIKVQLYMLLCIQRQKKSRKGEANLLKYHIATCTCIPKAFVAIDA